MSEERAQLAGLRREIPRLAQLLRTLKLCREGFSGLRPECVRKSATDFR
jgi:hypothetical protein